MLTKIKLLEMKTMLGNNNGVGLGQNQAFLGFRPEEYQETVGSEDEITYASYQEMYNSLPGDVQCVWSKFDNISK